MRRIEVREEGGGGRARRAVLIKGLNDVAVKGKKTDSQR
jgi:hypothetical protein